MSLGSRLSSLLRRAARSPQVRRSLRRAGSSIIDTAQERLGDQGASSRRSALAPQGTSGGSRDGSGAALADRTTDRPAAISYAPHPDGDPDPGEVVWGWVPFEEDLSQGKDRPVLVLSEEDAAIGGSDGSGRVLIALMLTSRDRADADEVVTDRHGATWVDVGTGDWDRQGRASEVRVDRLLRLPAGAVRREGVRLPQQRFDRVAQLVREAHGWADLPPARSTAIDHLRCPRCSAMRPVTCRTTREVRCRTRAPSGDRERGALVAWSAVCVTYRPACARRRPSRVWARRIVRPG